MTMTVGDWALLVGLLVNAWAVVYAARLLGRKVDKVHQATNGMTEALIAAARLEGLHAGEIKGRANSEKEHAVDKR